LKCGATKIFSRNAIYRGANFVFTKVVTIVKEIEQNQLTWYGHVQRMAEGRLPKIALKWMPKQ
jgi:hypothetical protein